MDDVTIFEIEHTTPLGLSPLVEQFLAGSSLAAALRGGREQKSTRISWADNSRFSRICLEGSDLLLLLFNLDFTSTEALLILESEPLAFLVMG